MSFYQWNFKFYFIWYQTDIILCLWSGFISPRIRTFVEKRFHGLFSKKKGSKSGGVPSFLNWSWGQLLPQRKTLPTRLLGLLDKKEQNLEIWPFLNSRLEMWVWECGRKIDPATGVTLLAGPIFGPLSTRLFEGFHVENGLISRFYFVPNPSNLLSQVLLCARSFHNRGISFRRIQILLSSIRKNDRENVFYKCCNLGQMFLRYWKSFPTRLLGLGTK